MGLSQTPQAIVPASLGTGPLGLIAEGTLSGASVSFTGLSSYSELILVLSAVTFLSNSTPGIRLNSNTGNNYSFAQSYMYNASSGTGGSSFSDGTNFIASTLDVAAESNSANTYQWKFTNCKSTGFTDFVGTNNFFGVSSAYSHVDIRGVYKVNEAISSLSLQVRSGYNFTGGTYRLWGAA